MWAMVNGGIGIYIWVDNEIGIRRDGHDHDHDQNRWVIGFRDVSRA